MGMGISGKRNSQKRVALSEINVTPLVDVMLVLLIIFMVTAPLMQQGIEVKLPETANSGVETNSKPFILIIKKNRKLYIGDNYLPIKQLRKKLMAIFQIRKNKQVYLQADHRVDYGFVAEAMGEIRAAGIYNISLITVPK